MLLEEAETPEYYLPNEVVSDWFKFYFDDSDMTVSIKVICTEGVFVVHLYDGPDSELAWKTATCKPGKPWEYSGNESSAGWYYLEMQSLGASKYRIEYQRKRAPSEDEWDASDNEKEGSTTISLDKTSHGSHVMGPNDPADWFKIELKKG